MKEFTVYDDIGKLPDNWVAILKDAKLRRISKCAKEELDKISVWQLPYHKRGIMVVFEAKCNSCGYKESIVKSGGIFGNDNTMDYFNRKTGDATCPECGKEDWTFVDTKDIERGRKLDTWDK